MAKTKHTRMSMPSGRMTVELDKDKLIAHIHGEWKAKWDARAGRAKELGTDADAYYEAYMEGARDLIDVILTFDDDIRGAEAIAALQETFQKGVS